MNKVNYKALNFIIEGFIILRQFRAFPPLPVIKHYFLK